MVYEAGNAIQSLAIGFIDNRDYRVLSLDKEYIVMQSGKELDIRKTYDMKIALFNYKTYSYDEFNVEECRIIDWTSQEFSHNYKFTLCKIDNTREFEYRLKDINNTIEYECNRKDIINDIVKNEKHQNCIGQMDFYKEKRPVYPIDKDQDKCKSYQEQIEKWFDFNISEEANNEFLELMNDIELAFTLNTYQKYIDFLEKDLTEVINLEHNNLQDHNIFSVPFKRVYIGNAFCHNLFPKNSMLINMLDRAKEQGLAITIVYPYIAQSLVKDIETTLDNISSWCDKNDVEVEFVVNDWGILQLAKIHEYNIKFILGRLLNKRIKDPRSKWKAGTSKFKEQLRNNYLNSKHFIEFLNQQGVQRFEFEAYHDKNEIPSGSHSLHFPYYQLNTGLFCPLNAECTNYNRHRQDFVSSCPMYCSELYMIYPKHLDMIGIGNSNFGFNSNILTDANYLKSYKEQGIDRLVYSVV